MKEIDLYSYQCGVIDCFNEMVKAGIKNIALAHPCKTKQERDSYIPFVEKITNKYQTHFYLDDDPLISDLFPYSLNRHTYNIIFYKDEKYIEEYKALKALKRNDIIQERYAKTRIKIAYDFGHLLSYSDNIIQQYIDTNNEKENNWGEI